MSEYINLKRFSFILLGALYVMSGHSGHSTYSLYVSSVSVTAATANCIILSETLSYLTLISCFYTSTYDNRPTLQYTAKSYDPIATELQMAFVQVP